MDLKLAINLLESHNEWRRGEHDDMAKPEALGEAIDIVVEAAKVRLRKQIERKLQQIKDDYDRDMMDAGDD